MKQAPSLIITNGPFLHHLNASSSSHHIWVPTLLYNALIRAYHIQNHKAVFLFIHMLANQVPPNSYTSPPLLKSSPLPLGTALHSQTLKHGVLSDPSPPSLLSMQETFTLLMQAGLSLFESMPESDVSWTTVVNGSSLNRKFSAAIQSFGKMISDKDVVYGLVKPNEATCVSIVFSCANLNGKAALYCGKQGKMGCLNYAENVFTLMVSKEVCTAMISSLASNGREMEALYMFEDMKGLGLQPNSITFLAVLTARACAKFVREGLELFRTKWDDLQVVPMMNHCGCLIDLLGRAGYIQEATDIIRNMPFKPDASVLGAFLGAYRIHGAIELGEEIGRKFELSIIQVRSHAVAQHPLMPVAGSFPQFLPPLMHVDVPSLPLVKLNVAWHFAESIKILQAI
ncbi:hypothetical protein RJT34_31279 [Clitoria ternatea]|uniref:Pentatricopeptide repeat-containing protein n=1 Tax=Clitoria ternatea TaxID=43366 RepID=A0AAN9EYB7_CLITE